MGANLRMGANVRMITVSSYHTYRKVNRNKDEEILPVSQLLLSLCQLIYTSDNRQSATTTQYIQIGFKNATGRYVTGGGQGEDLQRQSQRVARQRCRSCDLIL